jgi:anthranilate synthase component 1
VDLPFLSKIKYRHRRIMTGSVPLLLFEALYRDETHAFLYESMENIAEQGRYSFIGGRPFLIFKSCRRVNKICAGGKRYCINGMPFDVLKDLLKQVKNYPRIKPFGGGAIGYIGYDAVRYFEEIPDTSPDEFRIPDIYLLFPSELIVFDHRNNTADIVLYDGGKQREEKIISMIRNLEGADYNDLKPLPAKKGIEFKSNLPRARFCAMVKRAKEYIRAGDIFQVVISQCFKLNFTAKPITIYKALRLANPSPYMYYLKLREICILGSSPEVLVKLSGNTAISRPLAGTRKRGKDIFEDRSLGRELLKDEKERAEHIMLVDLARNDLGRVCEHGSVKVDELMKVERYSKVMHIVSNVRGKLKSGCDAFDLFAATFPAGTVSGAPKIRAMEIIDELEPSRRGVYAGAIGYFDFKGDMDFCIAIRMIMTKNKTGYIQGGAGIVADSVAENEYRETLNKTQALKMAMERS